jgi:hypothetical protein
VDAVSSSTEVTIEPPSEADGEISDAESSSRLTRERSIDTSESGDCLVWNSYSSSYATNFTGYSECSERLSDLHPGEEEVHHHEFLAPAVIKKTGTPKLLTLSGSVVGARGLPLPDGRSPDTYVAVAVVNKSERESKKQGSPVVENTADPDYNFAFDLGDVRKGLRVEFLVYVSEQDQEQEQVGTPLAYGKIEVKAIPLDSEEPVEIELGAPPGHRFKTPKWGFSEWGKLSVVLKQSAKEAQEVQEPKEAPAEQTAE